MTSHPEGIQQIFAATYDEQHTPKRIEFAHALGRDSLFILEAQAHRRMRRLIMPSLSHERAKGVIGAIALHTTRALDSWPCGSPFSLQQAMQELLLETTLEILIGPSLGARRAALKRIFSATYAEFASSLVLLPIEVQAYLERGPWVRVVKLARQAGEVLTAEIIERRQKKSAKERNGDEAGSDESDVLSQLVAAKDANGEAMSDAEIRDSLTTLFIAGHDTTANALSWSFACLLEHPTVCARLRKELDSARATRGTLNWDHVLELPFLDATVREVLRLRPIFPGASRTLLKPMRLLGYELPVGMRVSPSIYLVHRRPELFPDPERFWPERFLTARPGANDYIPFGGGVRRCVGGASVTVQMKVILATILSRAVLRAVPGPKVRTVRAFISLAPSGGLPTVMESRAA